MRLSKYIILLLLTFICCAEGFSQQVNEDRYKNLYDNDADKKKEEEPQDTLGGKKKNRPKKPFKSYLFPTTDSLHKEILFAWTYNPNTNRVTRADIDTLISGFSEDYIFKSQNPYGAAFLGGLGAPAMPIYYRDRETSPNFTFLNAYKEYLYSPDNVIFYNGKRPLSQFTYLTSGQRDRAEEQFRLTHAQNPSPSTGFNLTYRNNRTRGMYNNQQSINKNFSFAFNHTGERYTTHFGYVFNSGDMRDNGGVVDRGDLLDTIVDLPQNILMRLNDAKTKFKGNGFFWTQTFAIPLSNTGRGADLDEELRELLGLEKPKLSVLDSVKEVRKKRRQEQSISDRTTLFFGTSVEFMAYKKLYSDTKAQSTDYYQNWYINPTFSNDSIRENNLNMRVFAELQPFNSAGVLSLVGGGIGLTNDRYHYFKPNDYISGNNKPDVKSSVYVYGDANGKWRDYIAWDAHVKYFPIGYRSQDLDINGNLLFNVYVKNRPVTLKLSASFATESPSYWAQNYYSNHYRWNNDFGKQTRTILNAEFDIPWIRMKAGVNQIIGTNLVYYNTEALPTQNSGAVSVTSAYIDKEFVIGGLHLQHHALVQLSSDQKVAPVPTFAASISYFYRFDIVKGILQMEGGFNGNYTTEYYGYGYNPAVSQFYNQRTNMVGNMPWVDAYITGKWKRLRFIIKMQNVSYELIGGRNYFTVDSYPMNRRMLKYGISWSFYD